MPRALVAGFLLDQVRRIAPKLSQSGLGDWNIKLVPGARTGQVGIADVDALLQEAAKSVDTHVIGASRQDGGERKRQSERIRPYFRFRWLADGDVQAILEDPSKFCQIIAPTLSEELRWAEAVKPARLSDALLLPRSCFGFDRDRRDIWSHAEAYNDPAAVENAARHIEDFVRLYFRKSAQPGGARFRWIDDRSYGFDHRGPRHGVPPFPRNWKYSFSLAQGFHYDVSRDDKREVTLDDARGGTRTGGYLNVDPHGFIR